jgi:hypothetical protein
MGFQPWLTATQILYVNAHRSASLPPALADHVPLSCESPDRAGAIFKHSPYRLTASLTQTSAQASFRYPLIFAYFASFCSINLPIFCSSNLLYERFRAFTALTYAAQRWPDRSPRPKPERPAAPNLPALRTALPHPGSLLGQRSPA